MISTKEIAVIGSESHTHGNRKIVYLPAKGAFGYIIISSGFSFKKYGGSFNNVRRLKQLLAVVIAFSCLIGLAFLVIGITNLLQHRLEVDPTPGGLWSNQNSIVLMSLGTVYTVCSGFGYFGIYESKDKYSKMFMMISVSYGCGLFFIFLVWKTTIKALIPFEMQQNEDLFKSSSHSYYMYLILVSSVFQIIAGYLSYLICVNYVFSRGYYSLTQEEADVADFFENIDKYETLFEPTISA